MCRRRSPARKPCPGCGATRPISSREGFEFVTAGGQVVTTLSAAHLDAVLHGGWRIRQRPGPQNALGDIKFVFPNNDNIYLHHTPAPQLFERDRRDFSHGCIRVQDAGGAGAVRSAGRAGLDRRPHPRKPWSRACPARWR